MKNLQTKGDLTLGYQYTYEAGEDSKAIYIEHEIYFVVGFKGSQHIHETFDKWANAKKFYNTVL
jgi:nicotinic acid mononucleotide adenylyltransferase